MQENTSQRVQYSLSQVSKNRKLEDANGLSFGKVVTNLIQAPPTYAVATSSQLHTNETWSMSSSVYQSLHQLTNLNLEHYQPSTPLLQMVGAFMMFINKYAWSVVNNEYVTHSRYGLFELFIVITGWKI